MSAVPSRGFVAAAVGSVVGAAGGLLGTWIAIRPVVADDVNGWWHDGDGWLLFLVPPAFLIGGWLGRWLALRLHSHDRRARTASLTALFLLLSGALAMTAHGSPLQMTVLVVGLVVSPLAARWFAVGGTELGVPTDG